MNEYEIMLLIDPQQDDTQRAAILAKIQATIEKDGTWISSDEWGQRKLSYEIAKRTDAFYYVLSFDCQPETLDEITRVLRITDGVLRVLAVQRVESEGKVLPKVRERKERPEREGGGGRSRGRDRDR